MAGEGFYRVTVTQLFYGQQLQNVLSFHGPVADLGALSNLANDVDTIWVEKIRQRQTSAVQYTQIKVAALGTTLPPFIKTISKLGARGNDNELDPCNAFLVRLRTGTGGRHGRGRVYIGGLLKGLYQNGLVIASEVVAWNNTFADILGNTGFGSSQFIFSVMDKAGTASFPVTSMQLAPTMGHQRRRNIGIGI